MTENLNVRTARILIDQLVKQGVTYFCVSPGSRSTPLTIALSEHPQASAMVHFDERGTAFHALGYAKATHRAAAIIVTSGTAAGNLLPALMEACNERIPLIVITADRPPELRACGASQTCDQAKLFSSYVRWECDLPCPSEEIPDRFWATTIAHAVMEAHGCVSGPVHLNCMFRKPLFSREDVGIIPEVVPLRIEPAERGVARLSLEQCAARLTPYAQGLILAGSMPDDEDVESILSLAEHLKWPVFADVLSQVRRVGKHPSVIRYHETLLKTDKTLSPQVVIHFGDRIVSKEVKYWLDDLPLEEYIQVANHTQRQDPHHNVTWRFACSPQQFCRGINAYSAQRSETSWLKAWQSQSERVESAIRLIFAECVDLKEPGVIRLLAETLSSECALFLANSMPVRDADLFLFPDQPVGPLFGNRGVAGIDGNIATVAGIASGGKRPVIALLGDLTTLHDLNSLAQLKKIPYPVLIVVINNQGGGIFFFPADR